jgi:hypothetical protein
MRWECFTPQNRVRTLGLIGLFFLGACGSETTKTVTLRTGLEGAGEAVNLMKFWSPATFLSTPMCRQMDLRAGFGTAGDTPTLTPVETMSEDISNATNLAQVLSGLRIRPIKLTLPKNAPTRVIVMGSVTLGFDSGGICPKINASVYPVVIQTSYSFRGAREVVLDQQDIIDLRVWGIKNNGSSPSPTVCPGGDCPSNHFIKVSTFSGVPHMMIEFLPEAGPPARQILEAYPTSTIDYHVARVKSYQISKIDSYTGAITPCGTVSIQNITTAGYHFDCLGTTLAIFSSL